MKTLARAASILACCALGLGAWACGDSGDGGSAAESTGGNGGASTGGTSTGGAIGSGGDSAGATGGSGAATTGGGANAGTGGGSATNEFAICGDRAPDSTCTKVGTCGETSCGNIRTQLDSDGCLRPSCTSDADCTDGELCFPGPVVTQPVSTQSSSFLPRCVLEEGRCSCTGKDARDGATAYCVPTTLVLDDWGCSTSPFLARDCSAFSAWITAAESLLSTLTLHATAAKRAADCMADAKADFAANCP